MERVQKTLLTCILAGGLGVSMLGGKIHNNSQEKKEMRTPIEYRNIEVNQPEVNYVSGVAAYLKNEYSDKLDELSQEEVGSYLRSINNLKEGERPEDEMKIPVYKQNNHE